MEKSNSSKAALLPQPLAMVMCDLIWQDSYSRKHSLLGCFSQLNSSRFPFTHDRMSVYVLLTEGHGNVKLRLQLVDVDEERPPVVRIEVEQPFRNPTAVNESSFLLTGLRFEHPGDYRLQLFANGEFMMERRFQVVQTRDDPG
jgi:hypothetical protein